MKQLWTEEHFSGFEGKYYPELCFDPRRLSLCLIIVDFNVESSVVPTPIGATLVMID
jgi:hypothetical protein